MPVWISCALLAAAGAAGDTVVLKEEAYIKGPKVLLGDVAEIEGDSKEFLETVELASAALPGDSRRVNAALVVSRVKNAGIAVENLEVTGARSILTTTLSQEVPRDVMAESLRTFVESAMPWDVLATEVDISVPEKTVVVPDGDLTLAWRPASPQYRYMGKGVFRGRISVDGQPQTSIMCHVTVEPYADVVVARYDIPRGKPITAADLDTDKRRLSEVRARVFQNPEDLAGFVARATIFPGQVITPNKVTPRTVVRRNQIVTVEVHAGGLRLQSRARVRSDACAGDLVTCTNLDSKEEFVGIVQEDGTVVVE